MTAPTSTQRRSPDASMELLNSIQRDTIDPEYAAASAGGQPGRSRAPFLVLLVGLLAGLMFATSGLQAGVAADDASRERSELITRIEQVEQRLQELNAESDLLNAEIEQLGADQLGSAHRPSQQDLVWSGSVAVTGPGIELNLEDNPRDPNGIIVDQDLRQIVNGLWVAGAEAITINGHRLSARTAIRQAGAAITVNYRSLTTPYHIQAIGDPDGLESGFMQSPGGSWLNFLRRNYGVGSTIRRSTELRLGADAALDVDRAGVP